MLVMFYFMGKKCESRTRSVISNWKMCRKYSKSIQVFLSDFYQLQGYLTSDLPEKY